MSDTELFLDLDAACAEIRILRRRVADANSERERLVTIIDEAFGLQPVFESFDEMLTFLEGKLREEHKARVQLQAALDARGIVLEGWTCPQCLGFNSDAKERLEACRACECRRPER